MGHMEPHSPAHASAPTSPSGTEAVPPSSSTPNVAGAGALTCAGEYRSLRSRHTFDRHGRIKATWRAIEALHHARRTLIRATAPRRPCGYDLIPWTATQADRERHHAEVVAWFAWAEANRGALTYEERLYVDAVLEARRVKAEQRRAA